MSDVVPSDRLEDVERATGPVAAAVLAAGIGAFVLGLLTTLNEASTAVHDFLEFDEDVGPLSGKTIIAVAAYIVSWAVLHMFWRRQSPPLRPILVVAALLVALG